MDIIALIIIFTIVFFLILTFGVVLFLVCPKNLGQKYKTNGSNSKSSGSLSEYIQTKGGKDDKKIITRDKDGR